MPRDLQLRGQLRDRQGAGDPPGMGLMAVAEQAMTQAEDLNGARQNGPALGRAIAPLGQPSRDLLIGYPLPGELLNQRFQLLVAGEASQGAHGDGEVGLRHVTPLPNEATLDRVRGPTMDDHLVDQATQKRFLLLLREAVGLPPFRDLPPGVPQRLAGRAVESSPGRWLRLVSCPGLFSLLEFP